MGKMILNHLSRLEGFSGGILLLSHGLKTGQDEEGKKKSRVFHTNKAGILGMGKQHVRGTN